MVHSNSGHSLQAYWIYIAVWLALIGFTALTLFMAGIDLGGWNVAIALLIASTKAALVALFFMHLRFEGRWVWGLAGLSLFLLFPLIGLTLMDVLHKLAR